MNSEAIKEAIRALRQSWLDQPLLSFLQIGLFVIGVFFWVEARLQNEAFNVEIYGRFALQFPAEFWAAAMMGGSAMSWIGLRDPVRRHMILTGAAVMTANFLGLAYSAIATDGELIVGAFCSVIFAPIYAITLMEAVLDDPK